MQFKPSKYIKNTCTKLQGYTVPPKMLFLVFECFPRGLFDQKNKTDPTMGSQKIHGREGEVHNRRGCRRLPWRTF